MTTLDASSSTSEVPQSIQPGGFGPFVQLELAWGRLRRRLLRQFRPGYVQRRAELRQGSCSNCPHDVIDSRDLKFFRNVCGFSFRPEDDGFRWRDKIPIARSGWAELIGFSVLFWIALSFFVGLALFFPAPVSYLLDLVAAAHFIVWIFVVRFFRDPERTISTDPTALVSPADGTISHIEEIDAPDFPGGRAFRISIFLSVFNVHVNRLPRSGRVTQVRYFRGTFLDARHADCAVRNEQLWLDMEEPSGRPIRIKQISGAIARRIVCWLKPGETVRAGERFGMIKFGSRTDILIPAADPREVQVQVGDVVQGGSTVLLRLPPGRLDGASTSDSRDAAPVG